MITWASDRSGIASSGARDSDSQPHTPRPMTRRIVSSGLRALPAITRPMTPESSVLVVIAALPERPGRSHAALCGDEKIARADDGVALGQPGRDLDDVAAARADRHLWRAQRAVAEIEEYQPPRSGVDHRGERDDEPRAQRELEGHRRVHVRLELHRLVGECDANPPRPRRRIEIGI